MIYESTAHKFVQIKNIDVRKASSFGILLSQQGTSDITLEGLTTSSNFNSGIFFLVPNIKVVNVHARKNGVNKFGHGIYAKGDNYVITGCMADSNGGGGIHLFNSGGGTVTNNKLFFNGTTGDDGWGVVIYEPKPHSYFTVAYNIIASNQYHGLSVEFTSAQDTVNLFNNVMYDNGTVNYAGGISLLNNDQASVVTVENNVSFQNRNYDLLVDVGTPRIILNYNLYFRSSGSSVRFGGTEYAFEDFAKYKAATSQDAHSYSTDPLLSNPQAYDFTLQARSPCIDAGVRVAMSEDIVGIAVPQGIAPDLGAYEVPLLSLPVILAPMQGGVTSRNVSIMWTRSVGAEMYRIQVALDSLFCQVLVDTTTKGNVISLVDLTQGTNYYARVQAKNSRGTSGFSHLWFVVSDSSFPQMAILSQNYPNPFHGITTIKYSLAVDMWAKLSVFDTTGRLVFTVVNEHQKAGDHDTVVRSNMLASGLYFYRLTAGSFSEIKRFVVVK